ncbi:aspartic peptidase domain-containing protein [Chytriomyces cf. hyalinus JEL632]|nr:aspartic peptidase domain-containing protein [Chytriomyces cf. hyalinus JEL632]
MMLFTAVALLTTLHQVAECAPASTTTTAPAEEPGLVRLSLERVSLTDPHAPNSATSRWAVSGASSAEMLSTGDYAYYAQITVGTPAQAFTVQLDTGSSAMWLGSKDCNAKGNCNDRNGFDPTASSTFRDVSNGKPNGVKYGTGQVSGFDVTDTVTWGIYNIPQQQFILVNNEDTIIKNFNDKQSDGLIGLAWQNGNTSSKLWYPSVINSLLASKSIMQPVFSIWLNPSTIDTTTSNMKKNGGELVFGGISSQRFTGSVRYYKVIDPYFWAVNMGSVSVWTAGSTATNVQAPTGRSALFDSGTSKIYLESSFLVKNVLTPIYGSLGKSVPASSQLDSGFYTIPCESRQSLPDVSFTFGTDGVQYVLTQQDYVFVMSWNKKCGLSFMSGGSDTQWIFGDTFLRKFVSVYDFGKSSDFRGSDDGPRVGLAASAGVAPLESSSFVATGNASTTQAGATSSAEQLVYGLVVAAVAAMVAV